LFDHAAEARRDIFNLSEAEAYGLGRTGGLAFGVVRLGGESEADHTFIGLFRCGVELREAGEAAGHQRQDAGGQRVERSEVADGALSEDAANTVDYVVRGQSRGLID